MKIAHIVCSYPPYYGGMGAVTFQTVEALAGRGHEVAVFTPQYMRKAEIKPADALEEAKHDESLDSLQHTVHRLAPSMSYGNAARLHTLADELDDFDIVHLHYPFFGTANLVRKWKQRHPDRPLVITYHMDTRSSGWKGLLFSLYAKWYMPKVLAVADKVLVSSLDYAQSSDAASLVSDKWVGLPFGVDTIRFAPRDIPLALCEEHGLDPTVPTLLFVGGMDRAHYFKGVDVFLKSLLLLKKEGIGFQAVLVGDGDLRAGYMLKAKGYGLQDHVVFAGRVSDELLPYYYNLARVFVLPSIDRSEAFGMVLLEAMASGVPVLASDLAGVRTVALDGGDTFPIGDYAALARAIVPYVSDDVDLVSMQQQLREVVAGKYSWEHIIDCLEDVYTQLVSR